MKTLQRQCRSAESLDRNTAERMFVGLAADDAPPDFASVAAILVAAAAATDGSSTVPGEFAALRAYRDAVSAGVPGRTHSRLQPWRTAAGRIAVFTAVGAVAIGGGVAAAATGSLPAPAQRVVHQILGGFGVPAEVTPDADPADLVRPIGQTSATTSPGAIGPQSARTAAPATTRADSTETIAAVPATIAAAPATIAAAPAPTTSDSPPEDANRDDHGEAVSLLARSIDPGSSHGAAVCLVASGGACMTGDETGPDAVADHRSETGAENAAKRDRGQTRSDRSAKARQDVGAVADSAKDRRKGTGPADLAQNNRSATGAEHSASDYRRGTVNSAHDRG